MLLLSVFNFIEIYSSHKVVVPGGTVVRLTFQINGAQARMKVVVSVGTSVRLTFLIDGKKPG